METAIQLDPVSVAPLTDRVVHALRDAITRGDLAPGTPLRHADLSERLSVSYAPVREAIRQLVAEGYVTHVPHHGAVVAPLCADEISDLLEIGTALETIAIRDAMPGIQPDDLAKARLLRDELFRQSDTLAWPEISLEIRMVLYRPAGRPCLLREIQRVRRASFRYARVLYASPVGYTETLRAAHAFLDAFESRDTEATVRFLTEFHTRALAIILDRLDGPAAIAPVSPARDFPATGLPGRGARVEP
ncbi:MAG: GntR family transcriptional regulator [Candidatus Eisenbacteria bacterium]